LYGKHAHTKLIDIYQQAADISQQYNQWEQAVDYRQSTIDTISILYVGRVVSRLLDAYVDFTNTLCLMGKLDQAEEQLDLVKCLLPSVEHELTNKMLTFKILHGYMKIYQAKKSYQWAYEHYEKATVYRTTLEGNQYYRLQLAKFYLDAFDTWINYDKFDECQHRLTDAISIISEQCGRNHSDLAKAYCQLAILDLIQGKYELAEKYLLQAYEIYEKLPKIYPNYFITLTNLIKVYQRFKDGEKALLYAEKLYQNAEK
ncbi:16076_t:CDS:1, partial [Funneliformis geosporum]